VADEVDLTRFIEAQNSGNAYESAIRELRAGRKLTHWMWFVFPQVAGLGRSATSRYFAIRSLGEARAFMRHPVLGPRLAECAQILADLAERDAVSIFGEVDAQKLHSSLTLFAHAAPDVPIFERLIDRFFGGTQDPSTLELL
jgi:uncharacterized protein (DUF1810 family)